MADRVNAIVTTVRRGQRYTEANRVLAARTAEMLGIPNVPRGNASLEELRTQYGADAVLVARRGLLTLVTAEGELFFHPGMAHLRITSGNAVRLHSLQPDRSARFLLGRLSTRRRRGLEALRVERLTGAVRGGCGDAFWGLCTQRSTLGSRSRTMF